jgi:hypothetical protein
VLTLRQVAVEVVTPIGVQTELFPADETFTWSSLIVGVAGLAGVVCVLTIRSGKLHVARSDSGTSVGADA